jgi:hypothetical protein
MSIKRVRSNWGTVHKKTNGKKRDFQKKILEIYQLTEVI